jgi:Rrf2 family cysteine metabolism transcriptional repressor
MRLSTKGRYSVRAMLDLALHFGQGPIMVKDISGRQRISTRYLEQLFIPLRAAGLVRGIPGARGGFMLARPPAEVRLSEIVQATEGSLAPVDCVDESRACPQSDVCAARDIWLEMKQASDKVLESMTLKDLADRQREKSAKRA